MHKFLILTLSLASLAALASAQPAFAEKKRVCNTSYLHFVTNQARKCDTGNWKKYNCTTKLVGGGLGVQQCFDVDAPPKPTSAWVPGTGYNNSINQLKTKQSSKPAADQTLGAGFRAGSLFSIYKLSFEKFRLRTPVG